MGTAFCVKGFFNFFMEMVLNPVINEKCIYYQARIEFYIILLLEKYNKKGYEAPNLDLYLFVNVVTKL